MIFLGICTDKCLNGGKCIQKDTCQCPKGFYGLRCEYCEFFGLNNPTFSNRN